jgi:peptide/nickel transport system ATP-binding protein
VRFEGRLVTGGLPSDIAALREQTAMIFQDPFSSLNPRQTIGESIAEVLRVHAKAEGPALAARVNELLSLVGLSPEHANARPQALSGGQCQRVAIARALVNNPRIVFGDEPTGNLDSATGRNIMEIFKELHASGKTIILVTHDPSIASQARRVIELHDGLISREERK